MKKQSVIAYHHPARNLFYVGIFNEDTAKVSASVLQQYSRAKFLAKKLTDVHPDGDVRGLMSGFMMALINTDFDGWTIETIEEECDLTTAQMIKKNYISTHPDQTYVGSSRIMTKPGAAGTKNNSNWSRKFNVGAMKMAKIHDKVSFVIQSMCETDVPLTIFNDSYKAIVIPDLYGPRMKNFGDYQVDSLWNLFRFIRHSSGKDLA